mmetsp:Transcript_17030/g.27685  ORF Transcript_17030/g.27685 Transcript_17030/m.27685 type:complete len:526 (+) Transcript_17030:136-1713(+)
MTSGFSGAVKLADINDFLTPSQQCIKPQLDAKKRKDKKKNGGGTEKKPSEVGIGRRGSKRTRGRRGVKLEMEMDLDDDNTDTMMSGGGMHFDQIKTSSDGKTAKITLNDCLACSGCVTSAETVLISAQSLGKFEKLLANKDKSIVLSISPMSLAGLAVASSLSLLETSKRLAFLFHQVGVSKFVDQSVAQAIALLTSCEEFVERYRLHQQSASSSSSSSSSLPVLCSECPGWVCYAEKTQGPNVIKYLSKARSPQQIMGVLVKELLAKEMQKPAKDIIHCAVMPCYDKKLEASREEFTDTDSERKDVEIVLTTAEMMEFITKRVGSKGLRDVKGVGKLDPVYFNVSSDQSTLYRPPALGASGGYLENVFRYAARSLFDHDPEGDIKLTPGRNPDIQEATLTIGGEEKLRFALAYGFRNIQNTMRKLKRNRNPYHYVELMACPAGCANGGGQLKSEAKKPRELAAELQQKYYKELRIRQPEDTPMVKAFRTLASRFEKGDDLVSTSFRDVSKKEEDSEIAGLTETW